LATAKNGDEDGIAHTAETSVAVFLLTCAMAARLMTKRVWFRHPPASGKHFLIQE
jgi:hypothetical protein